MDLFGRKKDSEIDEYFVRDTPKNVHEGREEQETIEENTSDYIDPDDLNYNSYENIVDTIIENGWRQISSVPVPLTILDGKIVFPRPVRANTYDTVLEVICPPEKIMSMCGTQDCDIDPEEFCNSPNFYQIPHFFTLRCMDNNSVEISPTTIISILKSTRYGEPEKYYQEFYGDLSPVVDGKLKKKHERFYFTETIVLQAAERLIIKVNNPNIDISKIDLLMMSDFFDKDEKSTEY